METESSEDELHQLSKRFQSYRLSADASSSKCSSGYDHEFASTNLSSMKNGVVITKKQDEPHAELFGNLSSPNIFSNLFGSLP